MHKLLLRQIRRYLGENIQPPKEYEELLEAVSKTYGDYEREYALIERSLNISSKELQEANERLRAEVKSEQNKAQDLERFNKLMVNRELKMIELKKDIEQLKKRLAAATTTKKTLKSKKVPALDKAV